METLQLAQDLVSDTPRNNTKDRFYAWNNNFPAILHAKCTICNEGQLLHNA